MVRIQSACILEPFFDIASVFVILELRLFDVRVPVFKLQLLSFWVLSSHVIPSFDFHCVVLFHAYFKVSHEENSTHRY